MRADQLLQRFFDECGESVEVGHAVAVGVEAVEDAAVIGGEADADRLPGGQWHDPGAA